MTFATEKQIGTVLKRLKDRRVDADYKSSISISEDDAIFQYYETDETLGLLRTIGAI